MAIGAIGPSSGGMMSNRWIAAGAGSPWSMRLGGVRAAPPASEQGGIRGAGVAEPARQNPGVQRTRAGAEAGAVRATAYQRNRDGDDASLASKADELTDEERREAESLERRDREVRTHERAHVAAAGELFRGGPYYEYRTGPDGKKYAVGGRVSIDTSPAETPEATIAKASKIRAAALAPSEPSSADRAVAANATRMQAEARQEQVQQRQEADERRGEGLVERVRGEASAGEPVRAFDAEANAPAREVGSIAPTALRYDRGARPADIALGGASPPGAGASSAGGRSVLGTLYA